jgi:hypothetical protein
MFSVPIVPGTPPCTAPPLVMTTPLVVVTAPVPASVPPEFTVNVSAEPRFPVTASVPLDTVAVPKVDVPPKVQIPEACTSSVVKFVKLLFAVPVPCRISALVALPAVLPCTTPLSTEPVCKMSVLAPVPVKMIELDPPVMVPAFVTVLVVPVGV